MHQVLCMGSNIPHTIGDTSDFGIGTPIGNGLIFASKCSNRIALRIFTNHLDDFTQLSFFTIWRASLTIGIAGVVMG